jgi:hypothetical protein
MPDAPSTASHSSKSSFGFLTRKVAGIPVWIIALGIIGVIYWYEKYGPGAKSASSTANSDVDPATGQTYQEELVEAEEEAADQGLQIDIYNYPPGQKKTGTGTTTTVPPSVSVPPKQPTSPGVSVPPNQAKGKVSVPNVVGQRANFAIGVLESEGLTWHNTTGDRNPSDEYTVASQSPAAGTQVAKGTSVGLAFRQIESGSADVSAGTEGSTSPAAISAAQEAADSTTAGGMGGVSRWRNAATPAPVPATKASTTPAKTAAPTKTKTATAAPKRKATK